MTEQIDYQAVEVPEDKRPPEYTYTEKRAEIVRLWKQSNDPYTEISPTRLAERYEQAKSTLHEDIEIVKEYLRENIGTDDDIKTDLGFDRAIKKLEEQGKWHKAAKVRKMKYDWLHETGHKDKEPEEYEIEHDGPIFGKRD